MSEKDKKGNEEHGKMDDNGNFFQLKINFIFIICTDIAMNSPPPPEDASHATGSVLRGNAIGNAFQFADHTPGVEATSVIGIKKAAVHLYTTSADPTIAHAGGVGGLGFVKAKIPMNIYLHSVLQSLATLDSSIKSKL